ncbi:aldehyde dehydrogenase family protein [Salinicola sp. MIT1003]|uniref:aldehyde dehydrogenase family protein n=1 Tax=Salinicola sp. MIT1003 TaxID=1882734 RepID=UPI0009F26131|nr:aldehyde dehydrogenase family protein [Salinicola sp. MIT1003]
MRPPILQHRKQEIIETLVAETGFTLKDAENDFNRSMQTVVLSAEEAKRTVGEMIPIQSAPGQHKEKLAFTVRMPIGVACAITPFNSPLNTVLHKVGPAISAGNAVVLKPSSYTPLCATILCEALAKAGLPAGLLNLINGEGHTVGQWLLNNRDIDYYTFTGSTEVGKVINQESGLRRTQLELGNISSTIICEDALLEFAAKKCAAAAFRKAGQVCTSVQKILVHEQVIDRFTELLVDQVKGFKVGDPHDPDTSIGPMIDEKEAIRAEQWIKEALAAGATALTEPRREAALLWPTILIDVNNSMRVVSEEIFAPVVSLIPISSVEEGIDFSNDTSFGLASGIFTNDITRALKSIPLMRMGNVHINDTSSSRVDLSPYGGLKASGHGREGPRYAIQDMTEERLITITPALD